MNHCQQQQRTTEGTMLKYLTHKLRTHSLNEEPSQDKADDDHDSGTESDDEFQNSTDVAENDFSAMDSFEESAARDSAVPSDVDLGTSPPTMTSYNFQVATSNSQLPEQIPVCQPERNLEFLAKLSQSSDQHSSEEELEVINGSRDEDVSSNSSLTKTMSSSVLSPRCPSRPAAGPEKRKWSEANKGSMSSGCSEDRGNSSSCQKIDAYSAPVSRSGDRENCSGSSEDELQELSFTRSGSSISQPLRFRSSPPVDAHKPGRSLSPPPKLFHASTSTETRPQAHRPQSRPKPHSHHYHHHYSSQSSLDHLNHLHHQVQQTQSSPFSLQNPFAIPSTSTIDTDSNRSSTTVCSPFGPRSFSTRTSSNSSSFESEDCGDLDVLGACSPRKRHRPPQNLPRPCLNFEKMQQIKTQAVTNWRHTSEHGNKELSVFCW